MSFTEEMDLQLIEFVQQNQIIYDNSKASFEMYRIRVDEINELWKKYAETINRPASECAKRWSNIKKQYLLKNKARKYKYRPLLHFLEGTVKPPRTKYIHKDPAEPESKCNIIRAVVPGSDNWSSRRNVDTFSAGNVSAMIPDTSVNDNEVVFNFGRLLVDVKIEPTSTLDDTFQSDSPVSSTRLASVNEPPSVATANVSYENLNNDDDTKPEIVLFNTFNEPLQSETCNIKTEPISMFESSTFNELLQPETCNIKTEPISMFESSDEVVTNSNVNDETDLGYTITVIKEEFTEITDDNCTLEVPIVEQPIICMTNEKKRGGKGGGGKRSSGGGSRSVSSRDGSSGNKGSIPATTVVTRRKRQLELHLEPAASPQKRPTLITYEKKRGGKGGGGKRCSGGGSRSVSSRDGSSGNNGSPPPTTDVISDKQQLELHWETGASPQKQPTLITNEKKRGGKGGGGKRSSGGGSRSVSSRDGSSGNKGSVPATTVVTRRKRQLELHLEPAASPQKRPTLITNEKKRGGKGGGGKRSSGGGSRSVSSRDESSGNIGSPPPTTDVISDKQQLELHWETGASPQKQPTLITNEKKRGGKGEGGKLSSGGGSRSVSPRDESSSNYGSPPPTTDVTSDKQQLELHWETDAFPQKQPILEPSHNAATTAAVSPSPDLKVTTHDESPPKTPIAAVIPKSDIRPDLSTEKTIGVNNKDSDTSSDDEMLELSDDDINDLTIDFNNDVDCDATCEPAIEADLTPHQVEVLRASDEADDEALKLITSPDTLEFIWSNNPNIFKSTREQFIGSSGPTFSVEALTISDIFYKIFNIDFVDLLVKQTNLYAEQTLETLKIANKLNPHSRVNRWVPTNRDEMFTFLAFTILQGLYPIIKEEGYFGFNGWGTMPYFSKILSYDRYLLLKVFLHFVDNKTIQGNTDRLCKIQPIIDHFNVKFRSLYRPSQNIVINECLLKGHGKINFTQKIANKAAPTGIEIYELCESSTGYLWRFLVNAGKIGTKRKDKSMAYLDLQLPNNTINGSDPTSALTDGASIYRPENAFANIVYDLVRPLFDQGYTLCIDSFHNSPLLARCLKRRKTDCYGTMRLNRQFVSDDQKVLTNCDLRQGEAVTSYCADLSVMVWRDANIVSMISTYHDLRNGAQDSQDRQTCKPNIFLDYNKSMVGVDRKDRFLSSQPLERTGIRIWYQKLFRRLLNVAIYNAWVIFCTKKKWKHRQFREILADELLKRHRKLDLISEGRLITRRPVQQPTTMSSRGRPTILHNHFPMRGAQRGSTCSFCGKESIIIRKCEECDVCLCLKLCFKAYHKPVV